VDSASGLGIGLYQAARQAADNGYRLELVENRGRVVFELAPRAGQPAVVLAARAGGGG